MGAPSKQIHLNNTAEPPTTAPRPGRPSIFKMRILTIIAPPDADLAYIFHNMKIPVSSATSEPSVQIGRETFRVEAMSYSQDAASLSAVARTRSSMLWILADLREAYSTRLVGAGASLLAKQSDLVYFVGYTSSRARGAMESDDAKALQAALSEAGLELHVVLSQAEYDAFRRVVEHDVDRARAVGIGRLDVTASSLVRMHLKWLSEYCFGEEGEVRSKAERLGSLAGEKCVAILLASGKASVSGERGAALRVLLDEILGTLFGANAGNAQFVDMGEGVYECSIEKHAMFQFFTAGEEAFVSALCRAAVECLLGGLPGARLSEASPNAADWKGLLDGKGADGASAAERADGPAVETSVRDPAIVIRVRF